MRRTDHLAYALEFYRDAMAVQPLQLTYDQTVALAQLHATLAGVGVDMMGQLATRERMSSPEEQATIAQREARKHRR